MTITARRLFLGLPWVAGALVCVIVHLRHEVDVGLALENHRRDSRHEARRVAGNLNRQLQQLYDGLRALALLPGVRAISGSCPELGGDARSSVQTIYETLANAGVLSEVYLIPLGFDPDRGPGAPGAAPAICARFDAALGSREAVAAPALPGAAPAQGRVEIDELRALARELAWLQQHYPTASLADALGRYPGIAGPEVPTSDYSRTDPAAPVDRDRMGIALSVPIYGAEGEMRGSVAGVILSHALRDLLPSGDYALRNRVQGISIEPHFAGQWERSRAHIARAEPDPNLLYSEVLELLVPDAAGPWVLWVGMPRERFLARGDFAAAEAFHRFGLAAGVGTAVAATIALAALAEGRRRSARRVLRLTRIARRMQEILRS